MNPRMTISATAACLAILASLAGQPALAAPPANDNFASAINITSTPYTDSKSTLEATNEGSEPTTVCGGSYSIWYKYTAPSTGTVVADTIGSGFDTELHAFTGSTIATLQTLHCNDDSVGLQARIRFAVTAGTTYYIRLNGYSGARGSATFHLSSVVAPLYTQCPAAGTNSGCQYLVTAANDGTFSVAADPNQDPLPNGYYQSHLVGVQNDSGAPLCDLNLWSNQSFNFQTYGLCGNVTPQPAMCPFGDTLYEGPGVSFDGVTNNYGTILFTPCIPAGASAYTSIGGYAQTMYVCASDETCGPDSDADGVINDLDNCPSNANPEQENLDGDTYGDRCDSPDNTLALKSAQFIQKDVGRKTSAKGSVFQSETIVDIPDASGGFYVAVYDQAFTAVEWLFDPTECISTEKKITCESMDGLASLKITIAAAAKGKVPFKLKIEEPDATPPPSFSGAMTVILSEPDTYIDRTGTTTNECVSSLKKHKCK